MAARRIVLLGPAGAGKTTLARRIDERAGLPVICLDALWQARFADDRAAFRALLAETHAGEAWVSDGNFAAISFDLRLPRADLVVWLETPRAVCAWRAVARVFRPGEPHKLSGLSKALAYIARFDRVNRPLIEALREKHGGHVPVKRLRTRRDVEAFLAALA